MHNTREWKEGGSVSWRGVINVTALVALIAALLCLFVVRWVSSSLLSLMYSFSVK
jgi:hypothetical protein